MKILSWIQNMVKSLWKDVGNLFKPTEDDYPESGVQPFQGEPYEDK